MAGDGGGWMKPTGGRTHIVCSQRAWNMTFPLCFCAIRDALLERISSWAWKLFLILTRLMSICQVELLLIHNFKLWQALLGWCTCQAGKATEARRLWVSTSAAVWISKPPQLNVWARFKPWQMFAPTSWLLEPGAASPMSRCSGGDHTCYKQEYETETRVGCTSETIFTHLILISSSLVLFMFLLVFSVSPRVSSTVFW